MDLTRDVLPEALAPINETISPSFIAKFMLSRIIFESRTILTSSRSNLFCDIIHNTSRENYNWN